MNITNGLPSGTGPAKREKNFSFYSYIIKDAKLLQKYLHIYNISITKDMIIKHNFEFEN